MEIKYQNTISPPTYANDLLLRHEYQQKIKRLQVLESDIRIIYWNIDLMSQAQRMNFYMKCSKWPPLSMSQ